MQYTGALIRYIKGKSGAENGCIGKRKYAILQIVVLSLIHSYRKRGVEHYGTSEKR